MGINKLLTLDEIHEEYSASLWDTCSLLAYLPGNGKRAIRDSFRFTGFLKEKFDDVFCFIPESVEEESTKIDYNWIIKENDKLIYEFEKNDRILKIDELPLGPNVKKRAFEFEKKFGKNKVDWRVVSWGYELSKFFGSAAIISNDINHIGRMWRKLISNKIIHRKNLGFFPRRELDLYERFF